MEQAMFVSYLLLTTQQGVGSQLYTCFFCQAKYKEFGWNLTNIMFPIFERQRLYSSESLKR